jgi:hypothetical protein
VVSFPLAFPPITHCIPLLTIRATYPSHLIVGFYSDIECIFGLEDLNFTFKFSLPPLCPSYFSYFLVEMIEIKFETDLV